MKTFKVTFFERFDIFKVATYHNIENQTAFLENLAVNIVTLELAPFVRCVGNNTDYTETVNSQLSYEIKKIDKDYIKNYLTEKVNINL